MANTWIEPPPPQKGMGCFARGCLILLVFGIVLGLACIAGVYWGYRHHSAIVRGFYWATKTQVIADSRKEMPAYEAPPAQIEAVKERWRNFESAFEQNEPAEIELTADDLNDLIASNRHLRGNAFVSIEGNRLRARTSIPLQEFVRQRGYYLNADIEIEFAGRQSLDRPRLSAIVVNGRTVPSDLLDWKLDSRELREYLTEFREKNNVGSIEIRDGKVILRSRAE
jgi:hypothetical protein